MGFSRLHYKLTRLPRCIYHSATEKCLCKTVSLFLNLLSCPLSLRPSEEEGEIHFSPWDMCHFTGRTEARKWSGLQLPNGDSWTMVKLQAPPARSYGIWERTKGTFTPSQNSIWRLWTQTALWVSACTSVPHEPLCLTASRHGSDGLFHQKMWIEVARRMHQFGKSSDQMKKYTQKCGLFFSCFFLRKIQHLSQLIHTSSTKSKQELRLEIKTKQLFCFGSNFILFYFFQSLFSVEEVLLFICLVWLSPKFPLILQYELLNTTLGYYLHSCVPHHWEQVPLAGGHRGNHSWSP